MRTRSLINRLSIPAMLLALVGLFGIGCSDDPVSPSADATEDVAISVAAALAEDNGGIVDEIGDLTELLAPPEAAIAKILSEESITSQYDSATGQWTFQYNRQYGDDTSLCQARFQRTYRLRFVNQFGETMQYWTNGSDTARTVYCEMNGDSCRYRNRVVAHHMNELSANWTITGAHTDTITINGTYRRVGVDTLTTSEAQRSLNHVMNMNFVDVQGPRGSRLNLAAQIQGEITGTYQAQVAFQRGHAYRERNVYRNFSVQMGDSVATIDCSGNAYRYSLRSGETE